jgi:RNA polymerase sigma-70 factor (ECF subfamily)
MDDPIPTDIGRAVTQRCPRAAQQRLGHDAEVPALVAAYAEREAARAAAALDRLLALCAPAAAEIARSYVAQEADVADIAQDALLALSRHLRQLREPAAFAHWFATLAHNAARQWLRRERARRAERSLDVPARSAWLGDELPESPLDVPDPAAAAAFLALEARDQLHRLLGTLPHDQRAALALAYLEGRSHEQIARELGVTPRAAEGLVYRGLRRAQAVAAQCTDGPQELATWCPLCGARRLVAMLQPGFSPAMPFWWRVRCPGCNPPGEWMSKSTEPFGRYATLEEMAWEGSHWGARLARRWARAALSPGGPQPSCWRCGAPLTRECDWHTPPRLAGVRSLYVLRWYCRNCGDPTTPFVSDLATCAATLVPEWLALRRAAPRLRYGQERLVRVAGDDRVNLTAWDEDTGRRVTLAIDCATLEARSVEVAES